MQWKPSRREKVGEDGAIVREYPSIISVCSVGVSFSLKQCLQCGHITGVGSIIHRVLTHSDVTWCIEEDEANARNNRDGDSLSLSLPPSQTVPEQGTH